MDAPRLPDLICEARRELGIRRRVYPKWVRAGALKPEIAEERLVLQEHIVRVLEQMNGDLLL